MDGVSVWGKKSAEVVDLIRGPNGSWIDVTLYRLRAALDKEVATYLIADGFVLTMLAYTRTRVDRPCRSMVEVSMRVCVQHDHSYPDVWSYELNRRPPRPDSSSTTGSRLSEQHEANVVVCLMRLKPGLKAPSDARPPLPGH